jgi:GDP-4-dehydro-6-deoxy-D-mannose reductase
MPLRVLVTGANSFSASFLLPSLATRDDVAVITTTDVQPTGPAGTEYFAAQVQDAESIDRVVATARPHLVFHLAGTATNRADLCFEVNVSGTRHLLDACALHDSATRVVIVSSAAVYGLTRDEESPLAETTLLRPITPYGVTKAAAEMYALSLHRRRALRVAVVRPFNLIGPGLRSGLAPSDFVAQAIAIRNGLAAPELRIGNLEPRRDFIDIRDAVEAYLAVGFRHDVWGETFNIASGVPVAIADLLRRILAVAGVAAHVTADPQRRRPVEVLEQVGDAGKLSALIGWMPRIALDDSLAAMVKAAAVA